MSEPAPFPLSRSMAAAILREVAETGSKVVFTAHAAQRMRQRRILRTQVLRCLAAGKIVAGPSHSLENGNWECTVEGWAEGQSMGVAVAISPPDRVVVVTAFWIG